jgi:phosphate starvation-inducible protein PhoH
VEFKDEIHFRANQKGGKYRKNFDGICINQSLTNRKWGLIAPIFLIRYPMRKNSKKVKQEETFSPKTIKPLTDAQSDAFHSFFQEKNLLLHGVAGTGKTYISLYLALRDVLNPLTDYDKIIILRSIVASRDIGFLPGSVQEKTAVYEEPYRMICRNLYGKADAYDVLKENEVIEFSTTSFLRGLTLDRSVVIIDEMQNLSYQELSTVITRMGEKSRVIFCGDYQQSDLEREREKQGIMHFMKILKTMNEFDFIEFNYHDIVRSDLVKKFIIAESEYKKNNVIL